MCYKPAETLRGEVSWCFHLTFKWFKERKKKVYMERERERQMLTTNDIRWKYTGVYYTIFYQTSHILENFK